MIFKVIVSIWAIIMLALAFNNCSKQELQVSSVDLGISCLDKSLLSETCTQICEKYFGVIDSDGMPHFYNSNSECVNGINEIGL